MDQSIKKGPKSSFDFFECFESSVTNWLFSWASRTLKLKQTLPCPVNLSRFGIYMPYLAINTEQCRWKFELFVLRETLVRLKLCLWMQHGTRLIFTSYYIVFTQIRVITSRFVANIDKSVFSIWIWYSSPCWITLVKACYLLRKPSRGKYLCRISIKLIEVFPK